MEVAEDYEFWLRLTARYPVAYLDEPCIIKRAGQWDQLSEKYGGIEKFRIHGLSRLVREGWFLRSPGDDSVGGDCSPGTVLPHDPLRPAALHALAKAELEKKCTIYAAGCEKRGRMEEAERYRGMI